MNEIIARWILSSLVFFPLLGAALLFALPKTNERLVRHFALGISVLELIGSFFLVRWFVPDTHNFQFTEFRTWLPTETGVRYILGVDGLSLILVLLTTFISPLVLLSTYSSVKKHVREFLALFLFLESAMIGTFVALDLVLFYVFWEAMLIPMYFMIGVWGGKNRVYATMKFVLYTVFGSLLMLVAFTYLYYVHGQATGTYSTNLIELYSTAANLPLGEQMWLFGALTLAFAIKVPMFPVHTWLPDAHVEAPTAGSVILAGVLLKMGTYGLLRFSIPLFSSAAIKLAPVMIFLGAVGIIYGALIAWRQTDIKRLIAYSSVSHLGFVVAGIFALNTAGITGALYQMVNHGVSTGALFLLVGVIYERRHTRELAQFGGLAKSMPWFAFFFMIATLGSVALPGTGGFVGEWMILYGVFKYNALLGVLSTTGVVLGAVYMLWLVLKMFWGPITNNENTNLRDVSFREGFVLGSLSIAIFALGIFSTPVLDHTHASVLHLQKTLQSGGAYVISLGEQKPSNSLSASKGSLP
jgi:NADH-quinone oxidoreductase subunit M